MDISGLAALLGAAPNAFSGLTTMTGSGNGVLGAMPAALSVQQAPQAASPQSWQPAQNFAPQMQSAPQQQQQSSSPQSNPEWTALVNWLTSRMGGGAVSSSSQAQSGFLSSLGPITAGGTSIYSR